MQMKKTFTNSIFFLSFYLAQATNPVLNPGFETWSGGPLTPSNWSVSAQNTITQASLVTDVHSGSYAAQGSVVVSTNTYTPTLTTQAGGFPVTMRHAYLEFWYKVNLAAGGGGNDKFIAQVAVYNSSSVQIGYNLVAAGTITSNATSYTYKQVPIIYTGTGPDHAIITFTVQPTGGDPNPHLGTYFIVDDVDLSNTLIGIEEIEETNRLQVFPNPAHSFLNIKTDAAKPMQIKLSDAIGRVLVNRLSQSPINGFITDSINTESLSSGLYFLMLTSDKKSILRRVIVD